MIDLLYSSLEVKDIEGKISPQAIFNMERVIKANSKFPLDLLLIQANLLEDSEIGNLRKINKEYKYIPYSKDLNFSIIKDFLIENNLEISALVDIGAIPVSLENGIMSVYFIHRVTDLDLDKTTEKLRLRKLQSYILDRKLGLNLNSIRITGILSNLCLFELLVFLGYIDKVPSPKIIGVDKVNLMFSEAIDRKATEIFIDSKPQNEISISLGIFNETLPFKTLKPNAVNNFETPEDFFEALYLACGLDLSKNTQGILDAEVENIGNNKRYMGRVNIISNDVGNTFVIRIHDKEKKAIPIEKINISEKIKEKLRRLALKPYGLVLIAGATGHGKTTTIYSLLDYITREQPYMRIESIENPIEVRHNKINQLAVSEDKGRSFQDILKSETRRNPKKIFLGEINHSEPAKFAVNASLQSLFVISTIHAPSITQVPSRFRTLLDGDELFFNEFLGILKGIYHQSMHTKLCDECKKEISPEELKQVIKPLAEVNIKINENKKYYTKSEGCPSCNYLGCDIYTPIICSEVLELNNKLIEKLEKAKIEGKSITVELYKDLVQSESLEIHDAFTYVEEGILDLYKTLAYYEI